MVAHIVSPIVATTFAIVSWVIGMYNVIHPKMEMKINSQEALTAMYSL